MPSSTKIRSNADISKTGKMKVMSRDVGGGVVQHGNHKVTTNVVAASGGGTEDTPDGGS